MWSKCTIDGIGPGRILPIGQFPGSERVSDANMANGVPIENGLKAAQTTHCLPTEIIAFAARKEAHAKELGARFNAQLPEVIWAYFAAARQGSWPEVARLDEQLRNLPLPPGMPKPDPAVTAQVWSWLMEIYMAFAQFACGEPRYAFAFARDIIRSIPPGSIYLGGTDAGRGLVTALCWAHERGEPFFTITQNALTDECYLLYLREIYGHRIFIPSESDVQRVRDEYHKDLERREKENRLKPGEIVERVDGKIQATNQIAVMTINGALARLIFERNPDRQFFVEESFPLEWMNPHLAPHGLIMAISRDPLATITPKQVEQDQKFWSDRLAEMIGDWVRPETPVAELCAFAERLFVRGDLMGFAGDPKYVASEPACYNYCKLRSAIAGLYARRAQTVSDPVEQRRLAGAADFAFRQAFALNPRRPEVVFRWVNHFLVERQPAAALLVAQTASKLTPENSPLQSSMQSLVQHLERKTQKERV